MELNRLNTPLASRDFFKVLLTAASLFMGGQSIARPAATAKENLSTTMQNAEKELQAGNFLKAAKLFDKAAAASPKSFDAIYGSAKAYAGLSIDSGNNCNGEYFRSSIARLKRAKDVDSKKLLENVSKDTVFSRMRRLPLFLKTVNGYTFATAPSIAPYIVDKTYQTSCPGSSYCPIETLLLNSDGTFERTFHKNGDAFAECLSRPGKAVTDCKLEVGAIKGTWQVENRTISFLDKNMKLQKKIFVENPDTIDGLYFPDPNDGSTSARDAYEKSCQYIPD